VEKKKASINWMAGNDMKRGKKGGISCTCTRKRKEGKDRSTPLSFGFGREKKRRKKKERRGGRRFRFYYYSRRRKEKEKRAEKGGKKNGAIFFSNRKKGKEAPFSFVRGGRKKEKGRGARSIRVCAKFHPAVGGREGGGGGGTIEVLLLSILISHETKKKEKGKRGQLPTFACLIKKKSKKNCPLAAQPKKKGERKEGKSRGPKTTFIWRKVR